MPLADFYFHMKRSNSLLIYVILALLALSGIGHAQTKISLRDQSSIIDFTNAVFTRPVKTGTTLPAQCTVGDLFFRSNATPGQNLYACVSVNTWTVLAGSASSLPSTSGNDNAVLTVSGGAAAWQQNGGDISGPPNAVRVTKLQNRPVADIAPSPGMALAWNGATSAWEPQTISGGGGGGGSLSIQNDGTVVGSRGTLNWTPGLGLTNMLADTGLAVQIQQSVDTSVIQSRANTQSGQTLYCASASANTANYTCAMAPGLTVYTAGMVVHWRPDVNSVAGAVTLNIDTLGAKPVRRMDGATNPAAGDIVAGQLYWLWYDGAAFRLPAATSSSGGGGGGTTVQKDGPYLQIASSYYLMPGMYEAIKPNAATWADASSGGTWTTLDGGALALTAAAGGGGNWRIRHTSRGAATTITFAVQCLGQGDGSGSGRCAVFLRESASGRLMMVEFARQELSSVRTIRSECWTNATTFSGTGLSNASASALSNSHAYVRFQFAAGNVNFQVSQSGLPGTWMQMGSWSQTACAMAAAPDQAGVATMAANATGSGDTILTLLSFKTE